MNHFGSVRPLRKSTQKQKPKREFGALWQSELQTKGKDMGKEFHGQVVLITGGTSGIGLRTAIEFALRGAHVVVCGRHRWKWHSAQKQILTEETKHTKHGTRTLISLDCKYICCDVRVESQVAKMIETIFATYGHLDVCFNNAGVQPVNKGDITQVEFQSYLAPDGAILFRLPPPGHCGPTQTTPISDYCENPIATTIFGTMYCLKHELRCMYAHQPKDRPSTIINTVSRMGLLPSPSRPLYAASKAFVINLTRSVASQVAQKCLKMNRAMIRVNCVAPGPIDTPLERAAFGYKEPLQGTQHRKQTYIHSAAKGVPMERLGSPRDVAHLVLFLASPDQAGYITGSTFVVDGGFTGAPVL